MPSLKASPLTTPHLAPKAEILLSNKGVENCYICWAAEWGTVILIKQRCITRHVSIISFRVDKRLKARIDRLRHINWSELLRRYVETVVEQEERRMRSTKDTTTIKRAIEEMDRLAKLSEGSGWIAEDEVIRWRRRRYSYLTQV
ncbi:hypothetical protein HRbin02_00960 [Candidatus Calditenuaceae archaeon HR02]|nr:hypothetical protein HRbin02_00960 [Candidatus Calditenuaceae archaeon HR02]